jgi:tripartite-type tricarboxylate transporter receptor subunit TctC
MRRSQILITLVCFISIALFVGMATLSHGAEKYPSRAIKLICPMPAGSATDVVARKVADVMGKSLGQEMLVDNRVGAGGGIGGSLLAKSKPDGYTLGALPSSIFMVLPYFTKLDFDPLNDFIPFVQVYNANHWLYVAADSPLKTFNDFLQEAKKRQVLVGCVGMLLGDMAMQRIGDMEKLNLKFVPFGGAAPLVAPLLGGQVDVAVCSGLIPYVRAGKMRLLARFTEGPQKEFKEIPHVKELGYDVNAPGFVGYFAPKGLPKDIQTKLEEEFTRAVTNPAIMELIETAGETPSFRNSKDFAVFLRVEHERAGKLIKELGLGLFAKEKK